MLDVIVDEEFFKEYKKIYPNKQDKIPRRKTPVFGDFIQQDEFQKRVKKAQKELDKLYDEVQERFVY